MLGGHPRRLLSDAPSCWGCGSGWVVPAGGSVRRRACLRGAGAQRSLRREVFPGAGVLCWPSSSPRAQSHLECWDGASCRLHARKRVLPPARLGCKLTHAGEASQPDGPGVEEQVCRRDDGQRYGGVGDRTVETGVLLLFLRAMVGVAVGTAALRELKLFQGRWACRELA